MNQDKNVLSPQKGRYMESPKNQIQGSNQSRQDKLKQIDQLYKSQINKIFLQSKQATQRQFGKQKYKQSIILQKPKQSNIHINYVNKNKAQQKQINIDNLTLSSIDPYRNKQQDKIRASVMLRGQSIRTLQVLRKQNQTKQIKIRNLTNICQNLIEKLKLHYPANQVKLTMDNLKQFSQKKMQRLQNLFKIKNQQIFFKIKLQIINLLQQFQVSKQQITGINQIIDQSNLFSFLVKKLKLKLKDFKSKQQQNNFQIQKDKMLNQKYQQRIHFLIQTNQLLKLSQTKLKQKTQDLRNQLNQFIQKLKQKQKQVQDRQSQIFRLKKQRQQLISSNQKVIYSQKNLSSQITDQRRMYQAKQKQMKTLLSNYFLEKKKLESQLEEKQSYIQQLLIKEKFLEQENQRMNRQYVRWKQRYQWLEKQKQNRQREFQQDKNNILMEFQQYKQENNQGLFLTCKAQTEQALRKVSQYQEAYQRAITQLDQQRRRYLQRQQQYQLKFQQFQQQWLGKIHQIQRIKDDQLFQINNDHLIRQNFQRQQYQQKQKLLVEEMQARLKSFLAQNDRNKTQKLIELQNYNDQLKKQLQNLRKLFEIKQTSIQIMSSKKSISQATPRRVISYPEYSHS